MGSYGWEDEEELLPEQTGDDRDLGWGGRVEPDDDLERLVRERPPHYE